MNSNSNRPVAINVVIPTHQGRERYVERILQCLAQQSFKDFNVIIFDNDSDKQAPPEYLNNYSDMEIIYNINEKNIGPLKNITRALTHCRARYIKMMMSDDLIAPDFLEKTYRVLENNPGAGLVFTRRILVDDNEEFLAEPGYHDYADYPSGIISGNKLINYCIDIFEWFPGEPSNMLFRNGFFKEDNPFKSFLAPERYSYQGSFDLILFLKILSQSDAYFLNQPLSMIRQHPERASTTIGTLCYLDYFHFANDARFLKIIDDKIFFKTLSNIMKFVSFKLPDCALGSTTELFNLAYINTIIDLVEKEVLQLEKQDISRNLVEMFFNSLKMQIFHNIVAWLQKNRSQVYGYGTGSFARQLFVKQHQVTPLINAFLDSNHDRSGELFLDKPILHIDDISPNNKGYILILSSFYQEIKATLVKRGFKEIEDFCHIPYVQ